MTNTSYQWTGTNLAEVKHWLKDLQREITVDTSRTEAPALEIDDEDDGIIRIELDEYIIRHGDSIDADSKPKGKIHITQAIDPSELLHQREIATILAALRFAQANMDTNILEMSHFDEVDCLNKEEINSLCEKINFRELVL